MLLLPLILLLVASAALASAWKWGVRGGRPPVRILFPEQDSSSAPAASLRSCVSIEEAMLFKVMGVVSNCSSRPLRYPMAEVEFFDREGGRLDASRGIVMPEVLKAHEKGRFVLVTRADSRLAEVFVRLVDAEGCSLPADYSLGDPPQGFVQP